MRRSPVCRAVATATAAVALDPAATAFGISFRAPGARGVYTAELFSPDRAGNRSISPAIAGVPGALSRLPAMRRPLSPLLAAGFPAALPAAAAEAKVAWLCKPGLSRNRCRAGPGRVKLMRRQTAAYLRRAR